MERRPHEQSLFKLVVYPRSNPSERSDTLFNSEELLLRHVCEKIVLPHLGSFQEITQRRISVNIAAQKYAEAIVRYRKAYGEVLKRPETEFHYWRVEEVKSD